MGEKFKIEKILIFLLVVFLEFSLKFIMYLDSKKHFEISG